MLRSLRRISGLAQQVQAGSSRTRFASTLVLVDHENGDVNAGTLSAITAAQKIGGEITALVAGAGVSKAVEQISQTEGVSRVLAADSNDLKGSLPEALAPIILGAQDQFKFTHILSAASAVGKGVLPRVAAKLDVGMLSEITGVVSEDTFHRTIYAGNAITMVKSLDSVRIASVRTTAFDPASTQGGAAGAPESVEAVAQDLAEWESQEMVKSDRPSLSTAQRVVSGGRGVKSEEDFAIIYDLADKMGAAAGASRAAVDAGFCSNDMQVGQTGKIVAPELYVAVGISGAIQHLAGMKDSKVIVAINKDPEAPFFQVADYGLTADLFKAVPEMIEKL